MPDDLAAQLALIASHAPKLRTAGVQSLTIGGLSLVLLPPDPPESLDLAPAESDEPRSALEDPASYGLPDGAAIPGFTRPDDLQRKAP
jgi:hypothetical protein